ncbi:hypothetical protein CL628_01810 [bacterium]|nr:hypothetical protein [bacterium]
MSKDPFTGQPHSGNAKVIAITPAPELAGDEEPLIAAVSDIVDHQPDSIGAIISMAEVTMITSAALNALVVLHKRFKGQGGPGVVLHSIVNNGVAAVFRATQMGRLYKIVATEEEALAVFKDT